MGLELKNLPALGSDQTQSVTFCIGPFLGCQKDREVLLDFSTSQITWGTLRLFLCPSPHLNLAPSHDTHKPTKHPIS